MLLPAIMRTRQTTFLLLLLLFCISSCEGQTKIVYHEYDPTASDFGIVNWNIPAGKLPRHYLTETVDKKGRVIEIKFFENNSTIFDRLCYLVPWVKYEYPNDTMIIQYYLNGNGLPESGLECEIPYKAIYYLSDDKKHILKTQAQYHIDTALYLANGWTLDSINETLTELQNNQETFAVVEYYSKTRAKLNGYFPISKDFEIGRFYFNDTEKKEIIKALKKK
jgi:hypothetical protein